MTKDLTSGNPFKIILLFTLPLMLGNLFQQFYSLADTIIVGRFVGVNALAAVGATGSVNYLILGFVIGVCNGFAIPIAQLFGARDYKDLRRHVANAAWLCIAASVVLTIATVALTRPMMQLMQTPDDDGIRQCVELLEQVAQHQREREHKNNFERTAAREVLGHGFFLTLICIQNFVRIVL